MAIVFVALVACVFTFFYPWLFPLFLMSGIAVVMGGTSHQKHQHPRAGVGGGRFPVVAFLGSSLGIFIRLIVSSVT